jgi:hypothetical protein
MRKNYLKNFLNNEKFQYENDVVFEDGESIIDYVLVYVKDLSSIADFNSYASKIRESFIKILIHDFNIQIQKVLKFKLYIFLI